jgi:hypothetical protein
MRISNCGLAIRGVYAGAAVHADDLCTTSASLDTISDQVKDDFTVNACLNLNVSKLEVMKFLQQSHPSETVVITDNTITTTPAATVVWWQWNLSASCSVSENIIKACQVLLLLVIIGVFQGELNPLSTTSIFKTCIIPI